MFANTLLAISRLAYYDAKQQIHMVDPANSDAGPVSVMRARTHKGDHQVLAVEIS